MKTLIVKLKEPEDMNLFTDIELPECLKILGKY